MSTLAEFLIWHRALSLRTRILLLLLPLMLALAVLVVEQVADMLEAELEASARERLTAAADYVAHQIDSEIRLRVATLQPVAGEIGLEDPRVFGAVDEADLGRRDYTLVISPRYRRVVAASDKSRMLQPLPAPGVDPLLDRWVTQGYEGSGFSSSWNGVESLTASSRVASADWIVVTGIGRAEVLAPAMGLKRSVYLWGILVAAGFALILHLVLRRELLPLAHATRAMKQMTEGVSSFAPMPEEGAGEIGLMIASFNSLVAERGQAEERLRMLNVEMEQRVEERTRELTHANEALRKEVGRRTRAQKQATKFSDRLKDLTQRFVQVEESEKRRLARELHDRVSSSLMAVGLSVGLIKRDLGQKSVESLRERLEDTADLVKDTMQSAREISSDMHPASLDYDGLYGALEDYARKFTTRTGLPVQLSSNDKSLRLAPAKETALFRIVQEALMNCAKHARAKRLEVSMEVMVGRLVLTVADDGDGFDAAAPADSDEQRPGLGLLGMGERAEAFGGRLQIESRRGSGTRVSVDMATSLI